jgi:IclR family transcriptional regulator, KDG regulon repressor
VKWIDIVAEDEHNKIVQGHVGATQQADRPAEDSTVTQPADGDGGEIFVEPDGIDAHSASPDRNLLKSVGNALMILSAFTVDRPVWTLAELARELGLGKSSAFRILVTLEAHGFVRRNPRTGQYSPALKLWEIGCAAIARTGLREVASEHLSALVERTGETAYCAVLDGHHVVHIDVHVTPKPLRLHANIGDRFPAHAVGMGKVLLAYAPTTVVEEYIAGHLAPQTSRTIVEPAAFRSELEMIRRRGYAINRGEWQDEVWGVAAPIRDHTNHVVAAIAVAGPHLRLVPDLDRLGELIRETAAEMSLALGAPASGANG